MTSPRRVPPEATLRSALADAELRLQACGVESARHDVEEIAAYLLGCTRGQLVTRLTGPVPVAFADLVGHRGDRIPLQHITGRAGFRHEVLAVGPGVFIPRPETEVVAGWAIDLAGSMQRDSRRCVVVDLCAGSGAIAAAVAGELPWTEVHAVEADPAAIPWLRHNLRKTSVFVHHQDVDGCLPEMGDEVDVAISNPPYIPDGSVPVDPEVARYDPPRALWGGPDGLDVIRTVASTAARLLRPGGVAVVEHADTQAEGALAVFAAAGCWTEIEDHRDLAGRDRFVTARLAGHEPADRPPS